MLLQGVTLTKTHALNGLHLALARDKNSVGRCGWLFEINPRRYKLFGNMASVSKLRKNCKGEKSNGFQLERCEIRIATALSRLCFVMAVATLKSDGKRTAGGCHRETSVGGCSLATRQQLPENWLELAQGSVPSRMAIIPDSFLEWVRRS